MSQITTSYICLVLAIVGETIGTAFLKESNQFTRLVPSLVTIVMYMCTFYLFSITLKTMPVGLAYAIWSGLGIVLISLIGFFVFKQHLDTAACIGIGLIIAGVVVVNVFSKSIGH